MSRIRHRFEQMLEPAGIRLDGPDPWDILLIKPEGFLKLFFAVAKFDTGLHAPEKIRSQHGIPFFGVIVGHIADVPVDAKDFLQEQDARPRAYLGRCEIALEFT